MRHMVPASVQPTLVCMSWRGGARLQRCLESIAQSREFFGRCVVSITGPSTGEDMQLARKFQAIVRDLEVICTEREMPTMEHQAFWVRYLEQTGSQQSDWIFWLSYDDEVRPSGISQIVDESGNWPLHTGTAYFGPWAMRHESADALWEGDPGAILESWTSFPQDGPTRLRVETWICDQLLQPTYIQMSGSVNSLGAFVRLRDMWPRKKGPMRIEMAIAADIRTRYVEEFSSPVALIYGRPNSDRASYGVAARSEDLHLGILLARYVARYPIASAAIATGGAKLLKNRIVGNLPHEQWRIRGQVPPASE